MTVPVRSAVSSQRAYGQHIRVRSGLGDMLDVGRGERKALLHTFYHDLDKQKLVSTHTWCWIQHCLGGFLVHAPEAMAQEQALSVHLLISILTQPWAQPALIFLLHICTENAECRPYSRPKGGLLQWPVTMYKHTPDPSTITRTSSMSS